MNGSGGMEDMSGMFGSILNDPELMAKVGEIASKIQSGDIPIPPPPVEDKTKTAGHSEDGRHKVTPDKRLALLNALKPYMSPKRREAIDYIVKIGKLGDLLKTVQQ